MEKFYNKLFKNTFTIILTVVISVLVIVGVTLAATTISANIVTGGTFSATGNATTSAYLTVGSGTVVFGTPTSTLRVIGSAHFTTVATSSDAFWVGSGGTAGNLDLTGGDLYVQGSAEFDSDMFLGDGTGDTITIYGHITDATITDELIVGPSSWAAPTSTLTVDGSAHFTGKATTSDSIWVGTGGTINRVNLEDGDLYVQNDAEIDGSLYIAGTRASTTNMIISGNATTTGNAVFGYNTQVADATSTITFGSYDGVDENGLCLKFFTGGKTIWCYIDTQVTNASSGALWCSTTSCE